MTEEEELKNYAEFFDSVWEWSVEIIGADRAAELTKCERPLISEVRAAYAEALESHTGSGKHLYMWNDRSEEDHDARALIARGLGSQFNTATVPNAVAEAAQALSRKSQKPRNPGRSSNDG